MIEIIGVNYTRFCETYPERAKANMQAASDLCATGKVTPHLSGVYDFEDYTAAFARIENRQVTGRVVLKGPNWNT